MDIQPIGPDRAGEAEPERLPVGGEVRDEPSDEQPVENAIWTRSIRLLSKSTPTKRRCKHRSPDENQDHDVIAWPVKLRFGRPGTCTHGTIHLRYQTSTHGAGMTSTMPITQHEAAPDETPECRNRSTAGRRRNRLRRHNHRQRPSAAGRPVAEPTAGRRPPASGRGFRRPSASPTCPRTRPAYRPDRSPGDEVAQLGLRKGPLLLAIGCIKPRSVRHFYSLGSWKRGSRRGGWRKTHSVGGSYSLYSDRGHQLQMFSP